MNEQQKEIIRKAKKYVKRNHLTPQFGTYYSEYCQHSFIPARDFTKLVKGSSSSKVVSIEEARQQIINPAVPMAELFEVYENHYIGKPHIYAEIGEQDVD